MPGRFEVVSGGGDDVTVVVDYAHTDDALRNLLETARPLSAKRLITVFGCGGDRDRSKRPLMGMVAARLSDVVVITSDNPRSEDPARIIEEIERGIPAGSQASSRAPIVESVVDRAAAIERAVAMAAAGDVVLIAGKGHEKYQQIGDRVLPFDDGEVARAALAEARARGRRRAVVGGPIPLAAGTIAAAMNGRLVTGDDDRYVTGFSIDSRTLATGDLFFAIVARRDGHDFAMAASKRRAAGVVVSRPVELGDGNEAFVIEVADTTRALQDLARYVRRESGAKVVAITGSAGKTTTKDTIAELIGSRYRVVKNAGNLNNHLGLPLSLLELRHGADVAVMELGMNHAGEIRTLVDVATPEVRVWTNVGEAHIGYFGSARRDRGCEGGDPGRRVGRHAAGRQRRRRARDGAGAGVRRPHGHVRHDGTRGGSRRRRRGPWSRRHARRLDHARRRARLEGAAARPRPPDERAVRRRGGARDGRRSRRRSSRAPPASSRRRGAARCCACRRASRSSTTRTTRARRR